MSLNKRENRSNKFSPKPTPVSTNAVKKSKNEQDEIDPDDPCLKKEEEIKKEPIIIKASVGLDPR